MRALVLSGLAGLLASFGGGCKGNELAYHRVELPGFSLELPTEVTFTGDAKAQYRTGQVKAESGLRFVMVGWQVGPIGTEQEMPVLAQAIAAVLPNGARMQSGKAHAETVGGHKATWLDATIETVNLTFVEVECGARSVMIGMGAASGLEAMRTRILGSFTCKPIETEEKAISSAVPIGVDDPAAVKGWYRMPNQDAFTLTNGQVLALFTEVPRTAVDGVALEKVLPAMFAASGGTWKSSHHERRSGLGGDRDVHFGTMTMESSTMPAALSLWPCNDASMVMGLILPMEDGELEAGVELLTKVRCALPGDGPLPLDKLPSDVDAAPN